MFLEYLRCLFFRGHRFKPSIRYPGMDTCTFCRRRRKSTGKAF
ncbi:hypothetical protein [uncultured Sphingomonas sp.]|nr:hypothetical protein [uncultured Sphingomonas sp.]